MGRVTRSATIGGRTITGSQTRTEASGSGEVSSGATLAVGKEGALTTRTSDTVGTLTMDADHGIETGDIIDLYWDGGRRTGITVGTVAVNEVPISLGAGDVLPADETDVIVGIRTTFNVDVTATEIIMAAASCQRDGVIEFQQEDGTPILTFTLDAGEAWDWVDAQGVDNPFGADVGKVVASNGNSTQTSLVQFGFVVDNVA